MVAGFPGLFAKVGSVVDQVYRSETEALGIHSGLGPGINGLRRSLGGGYKAESADLHGVLGKPFGLAADGDVSDFECFSLLVLLS